MIDPASQTGAHETLHILLVEDNPEDEYLVRRLLRAAPAIDYSVTALRQREEVMDALTRPFDACLMDYNLGSFTALDILRTINPAELSGPIILLTGYDDFSVDQEALNLGVEDFISKSDANTPLLDRTIRYAHRRFSDQRQLTFLAHHDSLTGLLNRRAFLERLQTWLSSPAHKASELYLLYIDLDGFKGINDSWGHDVGDQVLCNAAQAITDTVRSSDLVARYGGDELIAAVAHVGDNGIEKLADHILNALRQPLELDDRQLVTTASMGIARAHHVGEDANEWVRFADHAMFAAKRAGRDTHRVYTSDIPIAQRNRAETEADLRDALEREELHLCYQAQVDIATGELRGTEALARWNHARHGAAIEPSRFVPLAEGCGLIRQLSFWTLDSALRTLAQWQAKHFLPNGFRLSINISPLQLLDPNFPALLDQVINAHQINPALLRLEITENFFVHESAAKQLEMLTRNGLSLALDDFGTGYSSLAMLAQLPVDVLKIDRAFIARIPRDPRSAALVRALTSLGHELGLKVIAEGVESRAQHEWLVEHNCRVGQGFWYAYPEPAAEFAKRFRERPDKQSAG